MSWQTWSILALLALVIGYRLWLRRGVISITVHDLKARLDAGDRFVLVDVREPHEFRQGHIPGAVNVPLSSLEQGAARLDPKAETLLICRSGNRSIAAYHRLKRLGFEDLKNVEGGMVRWAWQTRAR